MHGWKKKLDRELDGFVRNMPSEFAPAGQEAAPAKSGNRRTFRIVAAATACTLLLAVLLPVLLVLAPFANTGGVILMEINPAVRLYTDENGAVTAVYSENAEGDILLSDETFAASLRGIPAADAAEKLAGRALAAGFVHEDSAVRFTVAADKNSSAEELRSALESSVSSYFCGKGLFVPVLGRTAELSAFGEGNAREQAEKAQGTPVTVTEREAAATEPGDVEESYRDSLLRYTREVTDCVYRTASGKKAALAEIDKLNEQITAHEDNALSLPYWSLMKLPNFRPTENLAALMVQMEQKLDEYEVRYGQTLDGMTFWALHSFYKSFDLAALKEGMDDLLSLIEYFTDIFDPSVFINIIAGDDALAQAVTALFDGIGTLPETVEGYVESALEMLRRETAMALFENRAEAEKQRPALSYEEYRQKMQELADGFENFEDFWNSFQ